MLIILSPAKIQNFKTPVPSADYSLPEFLGEAETLVGELRKTAREELPALLNVNGELALSASDKYYNWEREHTPGNARQALFTYNGEVFHGLDAGSLSVDDIRYAQQHLRVLSGLYGVLRPLDLIQPYRLEMQAKLSNPAGKNLYAFWKEKITKAVFDALRQSGGRQAILNLASGEYSKAVQWKSSGVEVIDFEFLESRGDAYKPVTIYTKKARGLMSRYVIQNRIERPDDLKGFDAEGYWYNHSLSSENKLVFVR